MRHSRGFHYGSALRAGWCSDELFCRLPSHRVARYLLFRWKVRSGNDKGSMDSTAQAPTSVGSRLWHDIPGAHHGCELSSSGAVDYLRSDWSLGWSGLHLGLRPYPQDGAEYLLCLTRVEKRP